jgi:hypothetical protein
MTLVSFIIIPIDHPIGLGLEAMAVLGILSLTAYLTVL